MSKFSISIQPPDVRISIADEDRPKVDTKDGKILANAAFLLLTTRQDEKSCLACVQNSIETNDWESAHTWLEAAHIARLMKEGKVTAKLVPHNEEDAA